MSTSPTELDDLLIASLQRLTEHLDAQTDRIETLTAQLTRQTELTEQLQTEHGQLASLVSHLAGQVNALTEQLNG